MNVGTFVPVIVEATKFVFGQVGKCCVAELTTVPKG